MRVQFIVSNKRVYIPPRKDPRLPLVQPGGVIRPKGGGAGGAPYFPNWVMPINSYLTTSITANNQLTFCVWMDLQAPGNRTMLAVQGSSSSSRMISASLERFNFVPHAPNAGGQTELNAFVPGLQLFTCVWDATEAGFDRVRFWFNGLPAVMDTAAGGSTMPSGTLTLLADSGGALLTQTARMTDMWMSNLPLDFDDPEVVARFIDGGGNPVFLGANGELPLGGPPLVFMGSDMVAADWSAGENRGTLANFTKFGGNFNDVGPP